VSIFGDLPRLEPLSEESKMKWSREMEWLVSPCDYIVELVPSYQSLEDGTTVEVSLSVWLNLSQSSTEFVRLCLVHIGLMISLLPKEEDIDSQVEGGLGSFLSH
jgi:hypothetical protein